MGANALAPTVYGNALAPSQHLVDPSLPPDHIVNSIPNRLFRINQQLYDNTLAIKSESENSTPQSRAQAQDMRGGLLRARREIRAMMPPNALAAPEGGYGSADAEGAIGAGQLFGGSMNGGWRTNE